MKKLLTLSALIITTSIFVATNVKAVGEFDDARTTAAPALTSMTKTRALEQGNLDTPHVDQENGPNFTHQTSLHDAYDLPCPGAPKRGFKQYFDYNRHTWVFRRTQ